MHPPFTSEEVAEVEREVLAKLRLGLPYAVDSSGAIAGTVVDVFWRREYPFTEICFVMRGVMGDDTVGFAASPWDDPDDPDAPYEWFDTLDDFVDDFVMMSMTWRDETISAIPYLDVPPPDENGVRWL